MNYLVDTNILLWYLNADDRLPETFKEIFFSSADTINISIASLWEITIKASIGKLNLKNGFEETLSIILNSEQWVILPIKAMHLQKLYELPFHHNDPFDRILFAQSTTEEMTLLYTDTIFNKYKI